VTNSSNAAEVTALDEKNDKALDMILLYVAPNLKHHVDKAYTALEAWNTLAAQYKKPGAIGVFVAFQKLFNAQLSDGSALELQINAMIEAANQVNNAGIEVKE
jgi:ribosomal protein L44E